MLHIFECVATLSCSLGMLLQFFSSVGLSSQFFRIVEFSSCSSEHLNFSLFDAYMQFLSKFSSSITKIVSETLELESDPSQIFVGPHRIDIPA